MLKICLFFKKKHDRMRVKNKCLFISALQKINGENMKELIELNNICKEKLKNLENYELIEKIIFNEEETKKVGELLKCLFRHSFSSDTIYSFKEVISVFLVCCAKYYYNDGEGGFWQSVQNLTGIYEQNKRLKLIYAFEKVLEYNRLNKFEDIKEDGYKNIAPIIAHSGLPNNLINNLLNNLSLFLGQEISYNEIADEAMFVFRYASKNVTRYLKTLNQNGLLNDFIFDIITAIKDKKNTIDETSSLSVSIQEGIIKWCENKSNNVFLKNYKSFKQPLLKYDINTNQLLIETPEMTMSNNSVCIWNVFDGENCVCKKVYGEYINEEYFFRSTSIIVKSVDEIKIKLINDINECIKEFDIKEKNEFVTFNLNGFVNKSKFVLNTGAFILIRNGYASEDELEIVTSFEKYDLYYLPPTDDKETIKFTNDEQQEVVIKIKRPFGIISDSRLISDNCEFEGFDAFSVLPQMQVPIIGDWQVTISSNQIKEIKEIYVDNYILKL